MLATRERLSSELGREPTPAELARRVGTSVAKLRAVLAAPAQIISLETPVGDNDSRELGDLLEDQQGALPDAEAAGKEVITHVARALATLSDREREILRLRFGLSTDREHTLEEVSKRFGLTRERIRQIQATALRKLGGAPEAEQLRSLLAL